MTTFIQQKQLLTHIQRESSLYSPSHAAKKRPGWKNSANARTSPKIGTQSNHLTSSKSSNMFAVNRPECKGQLGREPVSKFEIPASQFVSFRQRSPDFSLLQRQLPSPQKLKPVAQQREYKAPVTYEEKVALTVEMRATST